MARNKARKSMVERGLQIDVDWSQEVTHLDSSMELLKKNYESLDRASVNYPEYYKRPFPAYNKVPACESDAYVFPVEKNGSLEFFFAVENPQGISAKALAVILAKGLKINGGVLQLK
jgi:hypothetical protein